MRPTILLACAGLPILAACARHDMPPRDPASIRELTGLAPPAETYEDQGERFGRIVMAADSLVISTFRVETDHPQLPTFIGHAECSGPRCELSVPATGQSQTVDLADQEFADGPAEVVGSRHGITLVSVSSNLDELDGAENVSLASYGAWMEHSGFGLQESAYETGGTRVVERFAMALGDLAGAPPAGGATWLGLMVGMLATGDGAGDRLQGDAALNYDLASDTLDVGFSGIKNIDRRSAHSTTTVLFTDLTIAPDGTFARGETGDRIQGGLYGPGHVEAAGIFERSNIVGAFGAERADE